jgi:hypothetical protein
MQRVPMKLAAVFSVESAALHGGDGAPLVL